MRKRRKYKPRPPREPSLRLHKPSGKGVVTLNGHDHYLGEFGETFGAKKYQRDPGNHQELSYANATKHDSVSFRLEPIQILPRTARRPEKSTDANENDLVHCSSGTPAVLTFLRQTTTLARTMLIS